MPLLDHFHAPLKKRRHWASFHHAWTTLLAQHLNRNVLPRQYVAEPHIKMGVEIESDVGTFEEDRSTRSGPPNSAVEAYAAPQPALTLPLDFAGIDLFEVQVRDEDSPGDVVAVIELVSPANKDRRSHRQAFTIKCASYLQAGVALSVVNVVTAQRANLHSELLALLGHPLGTNGHPVGPLYAVSYRAVTKRKKVRLEVWPERLTLGKRLPSLPLWLAPGHAVPVDLETGNAAACDSLRISGGA
jgi:hypothetical protein